MLPGLDLYHTYTSPAQHLMMAALLIGSTVDDLYGLYGLDDLYDLYDLCHLDDLYNLYNLYRYLSEVWKFVNWPHATVEAAPVLA